MGVALVFFKELEKMRLFSLGIALLASEAAARKWGKGKGVKPGMIPEDKRPCGGIPNVSGCTCADGEFYAREAVRKNCIRGGNRVVTCTCENGDIWEAPNRDNLVNNRPDKPGKGTRPKAPCDGKDNIESCSCEDGESYAIEELRDNCSRRKNPIKTCACADGSSWSPQAKPVRPKPVKPCKTGFKNVSSCECTDGNSYEPGRELWKNCGKKSDFKIKQCECADGEIWENPSDENN